MIDPSSGDEDLVEHGPVPDRPVTFTDCLRRAARHHGGTAALEVEASLTRRPALTVEEWEAAHGPGWSSRHHERQEIHATAEGYWGSNSTPTSPVRRPDGPRATRPRRGAPLKSTHPRQERKDAARWYPQHNPCP